MYTNCMLTEQNIDFGKFPNGAPSFYKLDTWKKYAPDIDWLSPDIYHPDYRSYCKEYTCKDNMLFIPETQKKADRYFYAMAEHDKPSGTFLQ